MTEPRWETDSWGWKALFVPRQLFEKIDQSQLGQFAKDHELDRPFEVKIPSNRDGVFLVPKPIFKYDCEHGLEVKQVRCPDCSAKILML